MERLDLVWHSFRHLPHGKAFVMIRTLRQAPAQPHPEVLCQPMHLHLIDPQLPQRALVRRLSNASLATPRYEVHMWDRKVPCNVELEQLGDHYYIVNDERPPAYVVRTL
jgi:hypothetical protein